MIAKRLQYGPRFRRIVGILGAYSFARYLFDGDHPNHAGMRIGIPFFSACAGEANALRRLDKLLEKRGRRLDAELASISGSDGVPRFDEKVVQDYLATGSRESNSDASQFLYRFDCLLSGLEELGARRRSEGMGKWAGELLEPLSICPVPGANLNDEEREYIARSALAKLSRGAKALAVWHIGKKVTLQGKEVMSDDLHLVVWNLLEGGDKPRCRTTELRNEEHTNDYLNILKRFCRRMVSDINLDRGASKREPVANVQDWPVIQREKLTREVVARELASCLSVLSKPLSCAPDLEDLSELVAELGWVVKRSKKMKVGERDPTLKVEVSAPGVAKKSEFRWSRLQKEIFEHYTGTVEKVEEPARSLPIGRGEREMQGL